MYRIKHAICIFQFLALTYVATKTMILNLKTFAGPDYAGLRWDRPDYDPTKYEVRYLCKLFAEKADFIDSVTEILESNATNFRVDYLREDVMCSINLKAVYNPASIDSGIAVTVRTRVEPHR